MKWLAAIRSIALAHILPALIMANAVNVLHITAEVGKYPDASFQKPVKRPIIGQLRIYIETIKRTVEYIEKFPVNYYEQSYAWIVTKFIKDVRGIK